MTRSKVESFLKQYDLRLDAVEQYFAIFRLEEDEILAGGGLQGDVIKCVAVKEELREERLFNMLVSHLMSQAMTNGIYSVKVYTKPQNLNIFLSLGFKLIAQSPHALFMENSLSELDKYKHYLNGKREVADSTSGNGLIIMNANPFTKGHRYLVEQASAKVKHLFVIVVKENKSLYDYKYRLAMVTQGCADLNNVSVLEGSDYQISAATFPTYFLKQVTDATDEHILLDLDVCIRHIIPTLGITRRFVGSEPTDALTARYNELMHKTLPMNGVEVIEIPRLESMGKAISASRVRNDADLSMVYPTSVPYVIGVMATQSLLQELDTNPKPGLIDKTDDGAHNDMNYALMRRSISSLDPWMVEFARMGYRNELPATEQVTAQGKEAEKDMLQATNGINTHKGALFALGLTAIAAANSYYNSQTITAGELQRGIIELSKQIPRTDNTHGAEVREKYGIKGALDMAQEGYSPLFNDWLPYYKRCHSDEYADIKLLLRIITTLYDNNIYYRRGEALAEEVRHHATELLEDFSIEKTMEMNEWMIKENLSPGGSADMMALTFFIDQLLKNENN